MEVCDLTVLGEYIGSDKEGANEYGSLNRVGNANAFMLVGNAIELIDPHDET